MMRASAVATLAGIGDTEVILWIERGWVRPDPDGSEWVFHDIDVARVRLIRDLRFSMNVSDDTLPLVLSLLDQIYDLRGTIGAVLRALETQPASVQDAVLSVIRSTRA